MKIIEINAKKVRILSSELGHLKLKLSEAKREIESPILEYVECERSSLKKLDESENWIKILEGKVGVMELEIERKREEREEVEIQVCFLKEKVGEMEAEIKREKEEREEVETQVNFLREKVGETEAEVRREEEERE